MNTKILKTFYSKDSMWFRIFGIVSTDTPCDVTITGDTWLIDNETFIGIYSYINTLEAIIKETPANTVPNVVKKGGKR